MGTQGDSIARGQRHLENRLSKRHGRPTPQAGDVLAAARTARADVYPISIVPAAPHLRATRHSEALDTVRELARQLGVDGWFTCNHTHYARVESSRGRERTPVAGRPQASGPSRRFPDGHVD